MRTINSLLTLRDLLLQRRSELERLTYHNMNTDAVAVKTSDELRITAKETRYDLSEIENRISEINLALLRINNAVKHANSVTTVECNINEDVLLGPLTVKNPEIVEVLKKELPF